MFLTNSFLYQETKLPFVTSKQTQLRSGCNVHERHETELRTVYCTRNTTSAPTQK